MIDALGAESLDDLQFITVSDMKALHMPGKNISDNGLKNVLPNPIPNNIFTFLDN